MQVRITKSTWPDQQEENQIIKRRYLVETTGNMPWQLILIERLLLHGGCTILRKKERSLFAAANLDTRKNHLSLELRDLQQYKEHSKLIMKQKQTFGQEQSKKK
jgi:hypothetical protein